MSKSLLRGVYASVIKNARARQLPVEITLADVEAMWDANSGRCALSGIPFDFARRGRRRRPFAPSIDRIDCTQGYTRANCRLVCVAVNYAMSDWGEGVLRQIAHGLVGRTGHAPSGRLPGTFIRHRGAHIRFEVFLQVNGRRRYLGCFDDEGKAHAHYLAAKASALRGQGVEQFVMSRKPIKNPSSGGVEDRLDTPISA